jgi:hypothetical protein
MVCMVLNFSLKGLWFSSLGWNLGEGGEEEVFSCYDQVKSQDIYEESRFTRVSH